jgi:hypothetical protein
MKKKMVLIYICGRNNLDSKLKDEKQKKYDWSKVVSSMHILLFFYWSYKAHEI